MKLELFHSSGLEAGGRSDCCAPYEAFLEALHGFLLVSTAQGRLVYVSENVLEYLGLSMVGVVHQVGAAAGASDC